MSRILIVEDDPVIRSAYKEVLESEGHEVTEAEDGVKALEATASADFDLIMLDILLPNMSGIEFLRKYRRDFGDKGAQVIVLSNVDHPDTVKEAEELGVKEYLTKSHYSMKDLARAISNLLANS